MKKFIILLSLVLNLFAIDSISLNNGNLFNDMASTKVDKYINKYKNEKGKEKLSYKELISFLKSSNDKDKIMILGILYSTDSNEPDSYGEYIKADRYLAQKYLLQSYRMGNSKALSMLGGLIFYNDNMAKLDPKLEKAEEYLSTAFKEGEFESGLILANVQLVKGEYAKGIQTLLYLANQGDASAQMELAFIFQKGIFSKENNKMVIEPDRDMALIFLNKACKNESKSEKITSFCYSKYIKIENK